MGMGNSFETITVLQYRLKAAQEELAAFQSGEKYIRMEKQHLTQVRALERRIAKLEAAVAKEHSHAITIRNQWFEIFEQLQKECDRMVAEAVKKADMMEKRAIRAERQRDTALEKVTFQRRELYKVKTELDDEKQKVQKLTAQINRNYENSSIPSSKSIARKKISNSREKTGRKPGGQPGHRGHCRKKLIYLPAPEEVLHDPDFKKTSKTITKQKIDISVEVHVTGYHADVHYNSKTGERIHAPFPQGVIDDVNYGGNLRAFLFLLNNGCCTSIDKSRRFLSDLTDGKINISKGMINNLCQSFAEKTESQRKELFRDMLLSPVMHTDCTNARVNGESSYVFVCAVPVTFYKYGTGHQECLAHVLRYLKDSMDNEKDRSWNRQMHSLIQEMIHYRNGLSESEEPDPQTVSEFEERYKTILSIAGDEYDYEPHGKYYRDGYNLYKRMKKYKKDHLLFLHNKNVPATNNEAERLLRKYKRKQAQAVSFRSPSSIDHLCKCMSMLVLMRRKEQANLFREIAEIFA